MTGSTPADDLYQLCPGFLPVGPPLRTETSLLQRGTVAGRAVIAKRPTDPRPWWQQRCRHEITIYQALQDTPAPVRTAALVTADDQVPLLIITALRGSPLHPERYPPPKTVTPTMIARMLNALARLHAWRPAPAQVINDSDYPIQLARYVDSHLNADDLRILIDLHTHSPAPTEVSHGDPHLANTCATPNQVALLDFEFTAWRPAGADHARLYLFMHDNPAARRHVLADVPTTAVAGFWTAVVLTACRELISHQRQPATPHRQRRMQALTTDLHLALTAARDLHKRL